MTPRKVVNFDGVMTQLSMNISGEIGTLFLGRVK